MVKFVVQNANKSFTIGIGITDQDLSSMKKGESVTFKIRDVLSQEYLWISPEDQIFIFCDHDEERIFTELNNLRKLGLKIDPHE